MIPFILNVQQRQIYGDTWGSRERAERMGDKVPFKENKDVLKLDRGDGHTTL